MPRSFPADFTTAAALKQAQPYFILQIDWTTGSKYYLDRPAGSFTATGDRHPATIEAPKVLDWGVTSIDLKEQQVGAVDERTIVLEDKALAVTAILKAANQQRRIVRVWRMFDTANVTWSGDAALMFQGAIKPFSWKSSDNKVSITIQNQALNLLKSVSHSATREIFADVPEEYRDRHLPICWGKAQRVEAICVSRPWETTNLEAIPTGSASVDIDIADHPDDIGIPTGTPIEVFIGQDQYTVTFTQSADPDNVPSTMTMTGSSDRLIASSWLYACVGTGSGREGIMTVGYGPGPRIVPIDLTTVVAGGTLVKIYCQTYAGRTLLGWQNTAVATITKPSAHGYGASSYDITFANGTINSEMVPGDTLQFYEAATSRPSYPPGTVIRPVDAVPWIYIANDLPSQGVIQVEGFGEKIDEAGGGRQDFIVLGKLLHDTLDGSVEMIDVETNPFTVNLNDSTWSATLGHNVTTINFEQSPRSSRPELHNNRIWVTLYGVEDAGDSTGDLITNPVLVLLEYLTNDYLLDVAAGDVDVSGFTTAAGNSTITDRRVGFAQIEPMRGIDILQEIARQCHCVLFFDQADITIAVLANSSPGTSMTFKTDPVGTPSRVDNIRAGSLEENDGDVDEIVSRLTGRWRAYWDDITGNKLVDIVRNNAGVDTAFGLHEQEMEIFIYYKRTDAEAELDFWLTRWARIFRQVTFDGFLDALKLLPGDWLSMTYTDSYGNGIYSAKAMEITRTEDKGDEGLVGITARWAAFTY